MSYFQQTPLKSNTAVTLLRLNCKFGNLFCLFINSYKFCDRTNQSFLKYMTWREHHYAIINQLVKYFQTMTSQTMQVQLEMKNLFCSYLASNCTWPSIQVRRPSSCGPRAKCQGMSCNRMQNILIILSWKSNFSVLNIVLRNFYTERNPLIDT